MNVAVPVWLVGDCVHQVQHGELARCKSVLRPLIEAMEEPLRGRQLDIQRMAVSWNRHRTQPTVIKS